MLLISHKLTGIFTHEKHSWPSLVNPGASISVWPYQAELIKDMSSWFKIPSTFKKELKPGLEIHHSSYNFYKHRAYQKKEKLRMYEDKTTLCSTNCHPHTNFKFSQRTFWNTNSPFSNLTKLPFLIVFFSSNSIS